MSTPTPGIIGVRAPAVPAQPDLGGRLRQGGGAPLRGNGAGIGASHQTGWTGLVAKLLQQSGE